MKLDRRRLIGAAFTGACMTAAPLSAMQAGARPRRDLDALEAHLRIRCYAEQPRTYWYYSGTVFGQPNGQLTQPMLHVEGVSHSEYEQLPAGKYRYRMTEAGYYLDPATRSLREYVLNPFTGERYRPEHYLSSQVNILSPDLTVRPELERLPAGLEYRGEISSLQLFKDTAWSTEDVYLRMPNPKPGEDQPAFRVQTSLASFVADRQALFDPEVADIEGQFYYQTLATWRPWMNMGTAPGVISWRVVGTKCTAADLPEQLSKRIAADHADFFKI